MLIRRVVGSSMLPTLNADDIVVAKKPQVLRTGDIVIARMQDREVIKRVSKVLPGGKYFLRGDNADHSTDSRTLGAVDKSDILGVSVMKLKFATSTTAPVALRKNLVWIPYGLAALTMLMLLTQLATFDKFVPLLGAYFLPGGDTATKIAAGLIVAAELFALPFWLRMDLSPLFRIFSLCAGVFYMTLWTLLSIWALTQSITVDVSAHMSNIVTFPHGWWTLIGELVLLGAIVLAAYILNAPRVFKIRP